MLIVGEEAGTGTVGLGLAKDGNGQGPRALWRTHRLSSDQIFHVLFT